MAADVNVVVLAGRLVKDAEISYTKGGSPVGNMSLAVNRRVKDGEQWVDEVSFFDVSLFGKSAEGLKPYLLKGRQVVVSGSLRQDRWEKDGQKFSRVKVVASEIELCGGQGDASGGTRRPGAQSPHKEEGFHGEDFSEDIPF